MEYTTGSFRNRLRRRIAFLIDVFGKLRAIIGPQADQIYSQRMCPFCGLITSRTKTCCLECGKSLKPA